MKLLKRVKIMGAVSFVILQSALFCPIENRKYKSATQRMLDTYSFAGPINIPHTKEKSLNTFPSFTLLITSILFFKLHIMP